MKNKSNLIRIGAAGCLAASLLVSCDGNKKDKAEPPVKIIELDELPGIVDVHGVIGSGTSMNVMELVSDDGDTTYIDMNSQAMMGGVNVGDEVQVIYNSMKNSNTAQIAINITALQHLWTQKGENGESQSLELNSKGRVSTYGMRTDYNFWEVKDGQLLLHMPRKVGSEDPEVVDTFEIMELTDESLVLMNGDLATVFEREN